MQQGIDQAARHILETNDKGGFTVPTSGLYPYQWNWDSVFVALGFAQFDPARACREIETLFEAQWDDGFVPHIIFRRDDPDYFPGPSFWQAGAKLPSSGITQPPVAATAIRMLRDTTADTAVRERIDALFKPVLEWHRWFMRYRVPESCGAVVITHPWESGRDNSPEWDAAAANIDVSQVGPYTRRDLAHADADMRPTKLDYDRYVALVEFGRDTGWDHGAIATGGPFRVADIGMTMILLRAMRDLIALAEATGHSDDIDELESYVVRLNRGVEYLWNAESDTFCSRDTITGAHSGFVTSASFLYAYADAGTPEQRAKMAAHWHRISSRVEYMVPSHDPDDVLFDHRRYWRGPVWIVVNYMIAIGFREQGLDDWADRVRSDSQRMIREHGFSEAFSPLDAGGTGGTNFSWTAAMWLAWCGQGS
ncbi:MAG: hypothetical protein AAF574_06855 [Pseudomonadota bacterium]